MRKDKSIYTVKIISLSILTLVLIFTFFTLTFWPRNAWNWANADKAAVYENTFSKEQVSAIHVDWNVGEVTIGKSSNDTIQVRQMGNKTDAILVCSVDNQILSIRHPQRQFSFFFFNFGRDDYDLEVKLPEKLYEELSVDADLGRVVLDDLSAGKIDITANMGEVHLTNLSSDSISVDADMGNIEGKAIRSGTLHMAADMGSVNITEMEAKNITLEVDMGSATVISEIAPDYLEANVAMGSLDISIPENDGFTIHTNVSMGKASSEFSSIAPEGSFIYKNGSRSYYAEVDMGSFDLRKN